jgi:REP element-mobilizing transposase RayT
MNKAYRLRKGRVSLPHHFYTVTVVTHNRNPFLVELNLNRCIIKQMQNLEIQRQVKSNSFVIMPDHLHWQFEILPGSTLSQVMRYFKGRTTATSRKFGIYKLWQKGYYDHLIRDEEDLINSARYIVANPLRAKLVTSVADYPYWDCVYMN